MFDVDLGPGETATVNERVYEHRLQDLDQQMRLIEAQIAATIAAAQQAGAYCEDGHSTIAGWCRATNTWSTAETSARIHTARLAQREPTVHDALATGAIGVPQARLLARAAANPRCGNQIGQVLPLLLQHAANLPYEDFRLVVRRWEMLADTDGTHRDAQVADQDLAHTPRPDDPRWWRSETTDGQTVPPDDIINAMIWGAVRRIVVDERDGTILDVGRRRRLFSGRARTAVLLGSARCTWRGCLRPSSRTQADHRTEHQHGGTTDISNGDACCPKHNRHKSTHRFTVTRDEHGYLHHHRPDTS